MKDFIRKYIFTITYWISVPIICLVVIYFHPIQHFVDVNIIARTIFILWVAPAIAIIVVGIGGICVALACYIVYIIFAIASGDNPFVND